MMDTAIRKEAIEHYETVYDASDFETIQAQYRKKLLIEILNHHRPKTLIEVGCGWETIAKQWQDFDALTIVEPGPRFAQQAREDVATLSGVNVIEAFLEDANAFDFPVNPDMILLSSILHEVPDVGQFLAAAKALCGKDTLVHINVPNARSMHRLLAMEMGLISTVDTQSDKQKSFNQTRIFDLDTLKATAESNGFEVKDFGSFFVKPFTHQQMQQLVETQFMSAQMLDGFAGLAKHFPENGSEIYINLTVRSTS